MLLDAIAAPLALLAVALPFLFAFTEPPVANFWPLVMAWGCGAVLLMVAAGAAWTGAAPARQARGQRAHRNVEQFGRLAIGEALDEHERRLAALDEQPKDTPAAL